MNSTTELPDENKLDLSRYMTLSYSPTRAYYFNGTGHQLSSPEEVIQITRDQEDKGILIVENISPLWIQSFEKAWSVDLSKFYESYRKNPPKDEAWDDIFGPDILPFDATADSFDHHVRGVVTYTDWEFENVDKLKSYGYAKRHYWGPEGPYPVSWYTCISYCRITPKADFCE
jgi:hypothetical protein